MSYLIQNPLYLLCEAEKGSDPKYLAWACVKRPFIMPEWAKGEAL